MSALRDSLRDQVLKGADLMRPSDAATVISDVSIWDVEKMKGLLKKANEYDVEAEGLR